MAAVYRKSEKGQREIETRADRLAPRLRTALILVDGRRSDADLRALIQLQPDATLQALLDGGYIEPVAAQTVAPPVAAVPPPLATGASALPEIRRAAVRYLTDQLGPLAETATLRIEKAQTVAELRAALELGQRVMHNARGTSAAVLFAERFIASLPG